MLIGLGYLGLSNKTKNDDSLQFIFCSVALLARPISYHFISFGLLPLLPPETKKFTPFTTPKLGDWKEAKLPSAKLLE